MGTVRNARVNQGGPKCAGIVGLGLIGGSFARGYAQAGVRVLAWDPDDDVMTAASMGTVAGELNDKTLGECDIIVLACYPEACIEWLETHAKALADATDTDAIMGPVVIDTVGVKGIVCERAFELAREHGFYFVGAHPMAGNELSGWAAADPHLYDGALWAITVRPTTAYRRFLTIAELIVNDCGNRLIVLDSDTHDRAAGLISHMPHVVATSLINELVDNHDRNIAAALAAGSWRDMTRVALTDPNRTRAMVEEDRGNVEQLLRSMASRLTAVADALRDGDESAMGEFFAEGQPFRDYKSAREFPEGELAIPEQDWQRALLESACRGEAITGFIDAHRVRFRIHAM